MSDFTDIEVVDRLRARVEELENLVLKNAEKSTQDLTIQKRQHHEMSEAFLAEEREVDLLKQRLAQARAALSESAAEQVTIPNWTWQSLSGLELGLIKHILADRRRAAGMEGP